MICTAGASAALSWWWLVLVPCFPSFSGAIVESCAAVRNGVLQSMCLVFKNEKRNRELDLVYNCKWGFIPCGEDVMQTEEGNCIV